MAKYTLTIELRLSCALKDEFGKLICRSTYNAESAEQAAQQAEEWAGCIRVTMAKTAAAQADRRSAARAARSAKVKN